MKIENDEIKLTGGTAVAAIGGLFAVVFLFQFFSGGNPEKNPELQALLREDVKRYLSSSNLLDGIKSAESSLAKNPSAAEVQIVRESMESLFNPKIISIDIDKSFLDTYCSDDPEYEVHVRYEVVEEQSIDLRYCLIGRKRWTRATAFRDF